MYLPENANVNVQIQHKNDFYSANPLKMDVDVAMVGRPTLDRPKYVDVPYAAHFQGTLVSSATAVEDQSKESDLRNPFRETLRITRFAMTNWAAMTAGSTESDPLTGPYTIREARTIDAVGMCGANTIQIYDQDGDHTVREVTPTGGIMAIGDRTWKVDAKLPPNAHFIANLSTILSSGYEMTRQAVAMIGYRTIPVTELGAAQ
jgi:hypothetical protein